MKNKISLAPCCYRFKMSVKDGILRHAQNYDETEWIISDGDHIYYCPYCGSYIKGEGFGRSYKKVEKIDEQEYTLIRKIITKYNPEQKNILDILSVANLKNDQLEFIHSVLSKEYKDNGLGKEDEPNDYGLAVLDLIRKVLYFIN